MNYEAEYRAPARSLDSSLLEMRERQELRLFRASSTLLLTLLAVLIVWAMPWLPVGMRWSDWNAATTVGFALLVGLNAGAVALLLRWAPLFLEEPKVEVVRALLGERLSVRSKVRFLNRLRFQCEQGLHGRNKVFSVALIELPPVQRGTPDGEQVASATLREVRQAIRKPDILGDSGGREIWVLLVGAGPHGSRSACARIAAALRPQAPRSVEGPDPHPFASAGARSKSTAEIPRTLLRVARQRAVVWTARRPRGGRVKRAFTARVAP